MYIVRKTNKGSYEVGYFDDNNQNGWVVESTHANHEKAINRAGFLNHGVEWVQHDSSAPNLERLSKLINKKHLSNQELISEMDLLIEACDPSDLSAFVQDFKTRIKSKISQELEYLRELKRSLELVDEELEKICPLIYDKAI